jgi:hypothetical protein
MIAKQTPNAVKTPRTAKAASVSKPAAKSRAKKAASKEAGSAQRTKGLPQKTSMDVLRLFMKTYQDL